MSGDWESPAIVHCVVCRLPWAHCRCYEIAASCGTCKHCGAWLWHRERCSDCGKRQTIYPRYKHSQGAQLVAESNCARSVLSRAARSRASALSSAGGVSL